MKKLAKVLLGAVALSALFVGCNNGLVANDTLSSPDLRGFATDNGAIVIKWDAVKDADSYEVLEMLPGTEEWQNFTGTTNYSANPKFAVFNAANKEATSYKFKVVAKTNKTNVLSSSESEITVDTEAFAEYTLAGSDIKIALQPGTKNKYDVSFPVNAGYTYSVKFINVPAANLTAKTLFACNVNDGNVATASGSTNYNGASYVTEKAENADGEEYVVSPVVDSIIVNADTSKTRVENFYAVVKATPANAKIGKTVYAVSTATATGIGNTDVALSNASATLIDNNTKVRVMFNPSKKNNAYPAAESFTIYRVKKTTVVSSSWDTIGSVEKVGVAQPRTQYASTVGAPVYIYDDTIAAYDTTGKETYAYKYYIVAEGNEDNVWTTVSNTWVSPAGGVSTTGTISASINSINKTSADTSNTYKLSVSYKNCTPSVVYGEFPTEAAANKAVNEELTKSIALATGTTETTPTNWTFVNVTDGVTTSSASSSTLYNDGLGGAKTTVFDVTLNPGRSTTTATDTGAKTSTTTNVTTGTYYVFKIYAQKADGTYVIDTKKVYVSKSKNGTADATYSTPTEF